MLDRIAFSLELDGAMSGVFGALALPGRSGGARSGSSVAQFPRHHAIVIDRNANCSHSPKPPFPSQRFDLVVDSGGGGFSTCEAVGARVWRIE
jgi:hypothetical protein